MMNGTLNIVTDQQLILQSAVSNPNIKVLVISGNMDDNDPFIQSTSASLVSVLLPPPSSSMMEMDGNIQGYLESYYAYLNSGHAFMFVCVILRAIYNGVNVILYTTPEESQLSFMSVISDFFQNQFGITVGTVDRPYEFNPNYFPIILEIMYMNNIMNADELLFSYPEHVQIQNQHLLTKLYSDVVPYLGTTSPTMDQISMYFNNRVHLSKRNIIDPIGGYREG